jgi:hypothetical protein
MPSSNTLSIFGLNSPLLAKNWPFGESFNGLINNHSGIVNVKLLANCDQLISREIISMPGGVLNFV